MNFKSSSTALRKGALALTALIACTQALAQASFTNSLGMTFIQVPAGSFLMGSCGGYERVSNEQANRDAQMEFLGKSVAKKPASPCIGIKNSIPEEKPQHKVTLRSFWLGETDVTLGQFKKFLIASNRRDIMNSDFMGGNRGSRDGNPVVAVSWHHAQAFVQWLNQVEGKGYRLPSEAEWEYACNAGQYKQYCGMTDREHNEAGFNVPIAQLKPNPWGFKGMSGKTGEWVEDAYYENYEGAPADGSARGPNKPKMRKVYRGAEATDWGYTTQRLSYPPEAQLYKIGFRVALDR